MKTCTSCFGIFPATDEHFYHHKHNGLLRARCKACTKKEARQNYVAHRAERVQAARDRRRAKRRQMLNGDGH